MHRACATIPISTGANSSGSSDGVRVKQTIGPQDRARSVFRFRRYRSSLAKPSVAFSAAGSFRQSKIRIASERLGLVGSIVRRMCWLQPHCVASTNVLESGLMRSSVSAPSEFNRTWEYLILISDSEQGRDTRHPSKSLHMGFCKASSLHKTVL